MSYSATQLPGSDGVKAATITGIVARTLGLVSNIIAIPIALSVLGEVRFAAFIAIIGLSQVIALSGLGVSKEIAHRAAAYGHGDPHLGRNIQVGLVIGFVSSTLLAAILSWIVLLWLMTEPELLEHQEDIRITVAFFAVYVVFVGTLQVFVDVQNGLLRMWIVNVWRAIGAFLTLLLVTFALPTIGTTWAAIFSFTFGFAVSVALTAVTIPAAVHWRLDWLGIWKIAQLGRELLGRGAAFILIQGTSIALLNLPPILVAWQVGASDSVDFGIHCRALLLLWSVTAIVSNPTWPAIRWLLESGAVERVRNRIVRSATLVFGAASAAALLFALVGDHVIALWVGRDISNYGPWRFWFPAAVVVVLGNQLMNNVLLGLGQPRLVAFINGVYSLLSLVGGTLLAHWFGPEYFFAATVPLGLVALILQFRPTWKIAYAKH